MKEKSYIQKITPFIDNMRVQVEEGTPVVSLYPFYNGQVLDWSEVIFNTSITPSRNDFNWETEGESGSMKVAECLGVNLDGKSRHSGQGMIAVDMSGVIRPDTQEPIPDNTWMLGTPEGMHPIWVSSQDMVEIAELAFRVTGAKVGWNIESMSSFKDLELKYDAEEWEGQEPVTATISVDETSDINGKYFGTLEPVNED